MKRALRLLGLGLVICLVAAHTLGWFWAERTLRRGVAEWIAAQQAEGMTISTGPATSAGWPLAARLELPDVVLGPGGLPAGAVLRTAQVGVGVSLLEPGLLRVSLPVPVHLTLPHAPEIAATAADWHIDVPLAQADRAAMDATSWRADWIDAGRVQTLTAALAHLLLVPGALDTQNALDTQITFSAQAIDLPDPSSGKAWPLGNRLASLSGDATLHGALPDIATTAAMSGWRALGGRLDVTRAAFGYGPLGVSGNGSATLDAALQPTATAELHVLGAAATVDALVAAHVLSGSAATAAKGLLSLLTRTPEDGGAPQTNLPLRLQDRIVSLAGFPLAKLPVLAWPQTP